MAENEEFVRGYCNSKKAGHTRSYIVIPYKCVDIVLQDDIKDRNEVLKKVQTMGYVGVCRFCKDFEVETDETEPVSDETDETEQ